MSIKLTMKQAYQKNADSGEAKQDIFTKSYTRREKERDK